MTGLLFKLGPALVLLLALLVACQSGPTPEPPTATPESAPTATPWPVLGPDSNDDRVGFPEGYQTAFDTFYVFDRPDNKQVRAVYANDAASSARPGEPFPYGSVLVMETYRMVQDEQGNVALDANGRFQREDLLGTGATNRQIAERLSLTEGTVKNYISAILAKTGFRDRTNAALYAMRQGLVSGDASSG